MALLNCVFVEKTHEKKQKVWTVESIATLLVFCWSIFGCCNDILKEDAFGHFWDLLRFLHRLPTCAFSDNSIDNCWNLGECERYTWRFFFFFFLLISTASKNSLLISENKFKASEAARVTIRGPRIIWIHQVSLYIFYMISLCLHPLGHLLEKEILQQSQSDGSRYTSYKES